MDRDECLCAHALRLCDCSQAILHKLKRKLGNFKNAYHASAADLLEYGFSQEVIDKISAGKRRIDFSAEENFLKKEQLHLLLRQDTLYPPLLQHIPDAPELLYTRGNLDLFQQSVVAVVGSRKMSPYGREATKKIVSALTGASAVVVSGLAFGIDSLAHQTALEYKGKTVAVLGSGLAESVLYPRQHVGLARRIIDDGGLLLSENPPLMTAREFHFPLRNRIIAGISQGTIVIQAYKRSGSLITAHLALDYNREVMAVPGSIFDAASEGTNRLLQRGARMVLSGQDVLNALQLESKSLKALFDDCTETEKKILDILQQPTGMDEIVAVSQLSSQSVFSTLTTLELKNYIAQVDGEKYVRKEL